MLRRMILSLALAFGAIAATSGVSEAGCFGGAGQSYSYTPCYNVCPMPCPTYSCVVYRYDAWCCTWVYDSCYTGPYAYYHAQQRVNYLQYCCCIPAYANCCYY